MYSLLQANNQTDLLKELHHISFQTVEMLMVSCLHPVWHSPVRLRSGGAFIFGSWKKRDFFLYAKQYTFNYICIIPRLHWKCKGDSLLCSVVNFLTTSRKGQAPFPWLENETHLRLYKRSWVWAKHGLLQSKASSANEALEQGLDKKSVSTTTKTEKRRKREKKRKKKRYGGQTGWIKYRQRRREEEKEKMKGREKEREDQDKER